MVFKTELIYMYKIKKNSDSC